MKQTSVIPVIDIFAGPGGLGEGFSALRRDGHAPFRVRLSIEMDSAAHRTLLLRSFFRQFDDGDVPDAYYDYLRWDGRWRGADCAALLAAFPKQGQRAQAEAWCAELRPAIAEDVDRRITEAIGYGRNRSAWVLIGGPPCQAYSLVGRARMLGQRGDRFYADRRHTLYQEYLRLLGRHGPSVFIMENVKGLLSATVKNGASVFDRIVRDLRTPPDSDYRYRLFALSGEPGRPHRLFEEGDDPRAFVVECERHAIPQARHRLIILGVLESEYGSGIRLPRLLQPNTALVPSGHAISDLPRVRSGLSREPDSPQRWMAVVRSAMNEPWLRIMRSNGHADVASAISRYVDRMAAPDSGRGGRFVPRESTPRFAPDWYCDRRINGVCNHEARSHRSDDLHRYLFVSSFGRTRGQSPRLGDFPSLLLPAHSNVYDALAGGMFDDRFRVQIATTPATTITSHISKDGHYFIHSDPTQCRSLTVREAARLQTFPDNYFFEGSRTEQYHQVGNAVPPLLARQIADIVLDGMRSGWN